VGDGEIRLDYAAAGAPVGDDLREAHRRILEHLRAPGTWWTGAERIAVATEARRASACGLCRARKDALSPGAVAGRHDALADLPAAAVEVAHRVRSDPARLSRAWFESITAADLGVPAYVELVGVVAMAAGLDFFARAMGIPPFALPAPVPGEPSRALPAAAQPAGAWVPMIAPEDATGPEADLYGGEAFVPNIMRALSLVPDEARALQRSSAAHYLPVGRIGDPTARRALDRMQMELVAARVSALNQCFY
jgi:hypothetical protein